MKHKLITSGIGCILNNSYTCVYYGLSILFLFVVLTVSLLLVPSLQVQALEGSEYEQDTTASSATVKLNITDSRELRALVAFYQNEVNIGSYSAQSKRNCQNTIAFVNTIIATTGVEQTGLDAAKVDLKNVCNALIPIQSEVDEKDNVKDSSKIILNVVDSRRLRQQITFYQTEKDAKNSDGSFVYGMNSRKKCQTAIDTAKTLFSSSNHAAGALVAGKTQTQVDVSTAALQEVCNQLQSLDDMVGESDIAAGGLVVNLTDSRKLRYDIIFYQADHDNADNNYNFASKLSCQNKINAAKSLFSSNNIANALLATTTQTNVDAANTAMAAACGAMRSPTDAEAALIIAMEFYETEINTGSYGYVSVRACQVAIKQARTILQDPSLIDESGAFDDALLIDAKTNVDNICQQLRPLTESVYESDTAASSNTLSYNIRDSRRIRYNIALYQSRVNSDMYFANGKSQCQTAINTATTALNNVATTEVQLYGDNDVEGDLDSNFNDNLVNVCEKMEQIYLAIGASSDNINLYLLSGLDTASSINVFAATNSPKGYELTVKTVEPDSALTCADDSAKKMLPNSADNTALQGNRWAWTLSDTALAQAQAAWMKPTSSAKIVENYPYSTGGSSSGSVYDQGRRLRFWVGARSSSETPECDYMVGHLIFTIGINN
jgi:hypothetical protein